MDVPPGPVKVLAADWLLREAVSNLVDNAIRYSPQGGDLTVRCKSGTGRQGWWWRTAARMSAEDIARACVRFRRGAAGKNKPGAGLGLAIVGTIAEILGAKLVLENRAPQAGLRAALVFTLENTVDAAPHHENHRI